MSSKRPTRTRKPPKRFDTAEVPVPSTSRMPDVEDLSPPSPAPDSSSSSSPVRPQKPTRKPRSQKPVQKPRRQKKPATESDAARVARLEQERLARLREDVNAMSPDSLRRIVLGMVDRQPGLVFDLAARANANEEEGLDHPDPQQEPQQEPTPPATPNWCVCLRCIEMPTLLERKCCNFAPESCISQRPEMDIAVLNETVLGLAMAFHNDVMADAADDDVNRGFRYQAYRQFIIWQHGRLGRGQRRVVPSCVVKRVRDKFPDARGIYTGYRTGLFGEN